jgi:cyclopropane-fatty-acyl-phospholipid synthase
MRLLLERGARQMAPAAQSRSGSTGEGNDGLHPVVALVRELLAGVQPREFAVRFWDGTTWEPERAHPRRFTLVINNPAALYTLFAAPNDLRLGEAYVFQDIDVEGDLESALDLADELFRLRAQGQIGVLKGLKLWLLLRRLAWTSRASAPQGGDHGEDNAKLKSLRRGRPPRRLSSRFRRWVRHSLEHDRSAIAYHYDVSNEFYQLWLDPRMVYTCAYFTGLDEDLDTAQERKLDHVCRKLRLQAGERFLDLGCGWGGLVIHAAQHYGVDAYGITLSHDQVELANKRISQFGLADRCRVEYRDYRALENGSAADQGAGTGASAVYDKIACVGMFEHVGEANLPACLGRTWGLLREGGVFLLHGIAQEYNSPLPEPSFVTRYVFPNGELVPLSTTLRIAEETGFEVRDVESLREHYAVTLRRWVERLETHRDEAIRLTDLATFRIWKLYMAASAQRFRANKLNLYQVLLSKPDSRGRSFVPLTRADWYA